MVEVEEDGNGLSISLSSHAYSYPIPIPIRLHTQPTPPPFPFPTPPPTLHSTATPSPPNKLCTSPPDLSKPIHQHQQEIEDTVSKPANHRRRYIHKTPSPAGGVPESKPPPKEKEKKNAARCAAKKKKKKCKHARRRLPLPKDDPPRIPSPADSLPAGDRPVTRCLRSCSFPSDKPKKKKKEGKRVIDKTKQSHKQRNVTPLSYPTAHLSPLPSPPLPSPPHRPPYHTSAGKNTA